MVVTRNLRSWLVLWLLSPRGIRVWHRCHRVSSCLWLRLWLWLRFWRRSVLLQLFLERVELIHKLLFYDGLSLLELLLFLLLHFLGHHVLDWLVVNVSSNRWSLGYLCYEFDCISRDFDESSACWIVGVGDSNWLAWLPIFRHH